MGSLHKTRRRLRLRHDPSHLVLLVLLAGGLQAAALTTGIDRAPRRVRAGVGASSSGSAQRLARGNRGAPLVPDAIIEPDRARARAAAASGGDTAPQAAITGAGSGALPALADAGVAADRTICTPLRASTTASGRGPPTA
jgi:hypothetical protein